MNGRRAPVLAGLIARIREVNDADAALEAVPFTGAETPEFLTANRRVDAALRALPPWLRWVFE